MQQRVVRRPGACNARRRAGRLTPFPDTLRKRRQPGKASLPFSQVCRRRVSAKTQRAEHFETPRGGTNCRVRTRSDKIGYNDRLLFDRSSTTGDFRPGGREPGVLDRQFGHVVQPAIRWFFLGSLTFAIQPACEKLGGSHSPIDRLTVTPYRNHESQRT